MKEATAVSLINDRRSFLKKTSMINERGHNVKISKVNKTDAMADKAMKQLGIPQSFRKSVLWLAWNRSEARFWELVEAAMSSKIKAHGRYFIASISQERRSKR